MRFLDCSGRRGGNSGQQGAAKVPLLRVDMRMASGQEPSPGGGLLELSSDSPYWLCDDRKFRNLSFSLLICKREKRKNTYFTGLLWELTERICETCSACHVRLLTESSGSAPGTLLSSFRMQFKHQRLLAPQERLDVPSTLWLLPLIHMSI